MLGSVHCRCRFLKQLGNVQLHVGLLVCFKFEAFIVSHVSVGHINVHVRQVVHHCLQISRGQTSSDGSDRNVGINLAVVLVYQLSQSLIPARTEPVHAEVDSILDLRVPSSIRNQVFVVNYIAHLIGDLECSECGIFWLAVANAQNQIAGSSVHSEGVDSLYERLVVLNDISHHKREHVSDSRLLAERWIREVGTYLRYSHLVFIDSGKHAEPAGESDVHEVVPIGRVGRMVDNQSGVLSERAAETPVKSP